MAATARREIDTGEEDIAAIAKQISDHAEAIYQTWKARGLAPTEILSCRPAPGIKLAESLRTKPKPEPKPDIKQRPEFRREHRPDLAKERPEIKREQRPEPRREVRSEPEGETIEVILPPDLVPQRNGTEGVGGGTRRLDPAAMRLEVAREEERLLRALRTGGVVAERSAERPDVVPPISLVDYAKSRYQDRLDTGARKPAAGASGERRASLGSHVTEARSKFEARARRASSAGAGETTTSAGGATPVRPFLTRGSVAERVLMFERCPSEATLELAKRKSPAATTWRGPHDVINRAQNYAASTPPKPSSAPAHTTLQRTVRGAANSGAPARVIPRFHFPKGRPPPAHQQDHALHKVQSAFATFPNSQVPRESFKHIVKSCECPLYWKMPLFLATQQSLHAPVDGHKFIDFWREMSSQCHDQASRFVYILTRGKSHTLAQEDFVPLVQDVVDTHPGLSFLKEATEFHSRYVHTVIARIFYCVNRSWSGRISIPELRRSNLLQVIQLLEDEEDINQVTQYFSYEHFYVIYCKFWELDRDHDLFIDKHDLARHNDHALSSRMIERVLSGCVTRGNQNRLTPDGEPRMSYTEFVWFLLAEEDKTHPTAIEYWFRCMDVDGDGYISMYELEYFYEEQMQRMEAIGIETLPFNDCLCQMLDMVHPAEDGKITLTDLKRCKLTPIFFDTFFNLEKYLDHEQRDPFATQRDSDCEMSEWDRFAAEEYELLVAEEGGSDAQDQMELYRIMKEAERKKCVGRFVELCRTNGLKINGFRLYK
ncbi:serine/threonine-protein phosphatase 2A regulatory subunit B'' subunit delta-like isoform X2 [Plodia interpunctella]|uniref:serine/threonine-protein phosphatase 2A regulatory subunit B'' subunit delta-like isoform X2 n=1 Tax=Plodia interpunctella TaxID=58824 RepID=UPI002368D090|nr:serine/threonine-protein phosphatase 2A regulatory subunit B'' subunit delta-like isoform X2 [Plodia interpunctella]